MNDKTVFVRSRRSVLAAALMALPVASMGAAEGDTRLGSIVVTTPGSDAPLVVETDPKAPRQPIPAYDGADFLKSIPGFSVIRKGGADGDPVFRGMSGSRLGIQLDGQDVYGGCGGRMDPPTAYVYPESYDRVIIHKGPQSVRYGPGNTAGVVRFERDMAHFDNTAYRLNASATVASFGRRDVMVDARGGSPLFYITGGGTYSRSDDYRDGAGKRVHSEWMRWNTHAELGWRPDENTVLALALGRSDGEAAYADRGMDGIKFERDSMSLKFERRQISPFVSAIRGQFNYSYVDHVMDNFSLRQKAPKSGYRVSNPDRRTTGGRVSVDLAPADNWLLTLGLDARDDKHRFRMGKGKNAMQTNMMYRKAAFLPDLGFEQRGVFAETSYALRDAAQLVAGLRVDRYRAHDRRKMVRGKANPLRNRSREKTLPSAFVRYEGDYAQGAGTWYVGLGHAARFPDFWEMMRAMPSGKVGGNFLTLRPEKTTQLDVGALWQSQQWNGSLSAFYGKVDDYLLMQWRSHDRKPQVAVHNVDATVYGLEADVSWRFASNWKASGAFSWVRGSNDTHGTALAQQPPHELRLGLEYDNQRFSVGGLVRLVGSQKRFDYGKGSIVSNGFDHSASSGFAVASLHGGWRVNKQITLSAGVDNLFDRQYAEHLSRTGAAIGGYDNAPTGTRLYEPGRTYWLKAQIALD